MIIILTMTLDQLHPGDEARVVDIRAGFGLCQRLSHLGLYPGDVVRLLGRGAFRGPLLVEVHGMQVALGCGVARHVVVDVLPGSAKQPLLARHAPPHRRRGRRLR